jgi:hypothetical protein
MSKHGSTRPPLIIFALLAFVTAVYIHNFHLRGPYSQFDYTLKLRSEKRTYDIAECVIRLSERHSENRVYYLGRSVVYGPPNQDVVLLSDDSRMIINIYRKDQVFILARMMHKNPNMVKVLMGCA